MTFYVNPSWACGLLLLLVFSSYLTSTPNGIKFMYLKFCLIVQSHLHQIQYVHMALFRNNKQHVDLGQKRKCQRVEENIIQYM